MIALICEVKVSGVIRDARSPYLDNFGVSRLFKINCRSNQRETGTQIEQNRKNQKPHWIHAKTEKPQVFSTKTETQMLKNEKSANCNEHQIRKTEVFWQKNRSKK